MKPKYRKPCSMTFAALLGLLCIDSFARPWRLAQAPNGQNFNCTLCHIRPTNGGPRNAFGDAVNAVVGRGSREAFWSAALAEVDSDGDGFTNGQELGDPDGDGVPIPGAPVTHPGDAESKPGLLFEVRGAEDIGLQRIVPDKIIFETEWDNLDNWEPYTAVVGTHTFLIEANTFAEPIEDGNQRYALILQPTSGGEAKPAAGFYGDDGAPHTGQINASRQDGNPGRPAGDRRPGAAGYVIGGEASPHVFEAFQSDNRWNLGFDRLADGRYGTVQMFALDRATLVPKPTSLAIDAVNGRLTSGSPAGNQIGRFGGDLAVLDNGNIVAIVDDRSGIREASNAAIAVILAPNGSVVRESWVIDPRDIWSNVSSYKGGFCVRVHDTLYFHDNAGELLGQIHQINDLPETLKFDTARGDGTRIASHINRSLVFLAGTTDLFDSEGVVLEDDQGQIRRGVQIAVFDAASQTFLSHRTVSEVSAPNGGSDNGDLLGNFGHVNLAADALGRVAVAFEVEQEEAANPQTLVRVLTYEQTANAWDALTPSFFAFQNHGHSETRTFRPSVSLTTKQILVAAKGEINRANNPAAGVDTPWQTTFYTVFSHPDPQDDPTPGVAVGAKPIVISIAPAGNAITLTWSGGAGPFLLQRKTSVGDAIWENLEEIAERTASAPITRSMGLFRIVDIGAEE